MSVDRLFLGFIALILQMGNLQDKHGLDCRSERVIDAIVAFLGAQIFSRGPKCSEDPRPIESLASAMFAEAHGSLP